MRQSIMADDRTDALRFRALADIPGAEMHGSAGVDPAKGRRLYAGTPGQVHFGARLSAVPLGQPSVVQWARFALRAIVEDVIAAEGGEAPASAVGASDADDAARWRALMRLPRIRLMAHDGDGLRAEFWSSGTPSSTGQDDPAEARIHLARLADAIVARQAGG